jgi:hypothetical protein
MSDIKKLLEAMDSMSAAEKKSTGPKWPGYWRGKDSANKSRKKMVGDGGTAESVEESQNLLKELTQVINKNPVRRDLFQEWAEFKEGFTDTVKSTADKIVSAGSATRDALSGVVDSMPSIPRPFDEIEVAKDIKKGQAAYPSPKNDWRNTDKKEKSTSKNEDKKTPATQDLEEQQFFEYGAAGSGIGNDTATNPAEVFAKGQERRANKDQVAGQISGLVAQLQGARRQLADLNKGFPQGANPVEKAMSLQQMQGQKGGVKQQIEDLSSQIAQLRQQAM